MYNIVERAETITAVNYADRATLSIAGTEVAKELQLSAVSMGYIFSAFGWAYLLMQIPGGWLLDKFGSKKVYTYSLFFWSLFTFLQGFVDMFPLAWAGISMFFMRFMLGFSEAPSFPANARIVAAWFPTKERVSVAGETIGVCGQFVTGLAGLCRRVASGCAVAVIGEGLCVTGPAGI